VNATATTVDASPLGRWGHRLRLGVATLVVWFATDQLASPLVWGHPYEAPLTLAVGHPAAGSLIVLAGLLLAATLAASIVRGDACLTLVAVGAGVTLWSATGGTMDDWLIARHPAPAPPEAGLYRPLILEYVVLAVVAAVIMFVAAAIRTRRIDRSLLTMRTLDPYGELRGSGPRTLATVVVVAAVLVPILVGPRAGWTRHGQVYFALIAGFFVATLAGRHVGQARGLLWYAAAPLIVGLAGVFWAMARPSPGGAYADIDVIPANGLVRPLPVEMVFTSLAAIGWTLYSRRRREAP